MGKPKTISDVDLEALGAELSRMLEAAVTAWTLAMKVMPISSREYKAICAAGQKTQSAYNLLRDEAWARQWPSEKVDRIFTSKSAYGFS